MYCKYQIAYIKTHPQEQLLRETNESKWNQRCDFQSLILSSNRRGENMPNNAWSD